MLSDFDMLQNLQTLSTLQPNQKICTTSRLFSAYDTGLFSSLWRTWYGEDRQANVDRLQALFAVAIMRYDVLSLRASDAPLQSRIIDALTNALPGLERLAQTYRGDAAVVSSISVLLCHVRSFLGQRSGNQDPSAHKDE
jgi:hypothetical protein